MATTAIGRKLGAVPHWERASWVPIQRSVVRVKACMRAEFHLDPSYRLATLHLRHSLTDRTDRAGQTTVRQHGANRFTIGRQKAVINYFSSTALVVNNL